FFPFFYLKNGEIDYFLFVNCKDGFNQQNSTFSTQAVNYTTLLVFKNNQYNHAKETLCQTTYA
ncbi:MAG: hypothetical protein ACOVQE_03025, partial [Chitinophagaceae bacterium]